ncbi:N-acetyllactosaminide beta-1,3-N-acetylglucosaminyltransferase 3-like [Anolis carolinensis]|uniref:N-acetyllactosaminide beta-1,3-N-acetylglucosaminyltransferase 3-like n=1 Tax=Anolis carolinensis TaxID=28377 RepID=UPI002F2B6E51
MWFFALGERGREEAPVAVNHPLFSNPGPALVPPPAAQVRLPSGALPGAQSEQQTPRVRMVRGWPYKLEAIALTLVGFTGFFFLLQSGQGPSVPKEVTIETWTLGPETTTRAPRPACRANTSAANVPGFADLPAHIQDFLRYKHCRDFPLLLDAPHKCVRTEVFLLLAIKSSPGNYERRAAIRQTWGQERTFEGAPIRRVFLFGVAPDPRESGKLNRLLAMEASDFGDVLQWGFWDTFFNLTLKQTLFHGWLAERCPAAKFVFNGDDDVFANTDNMVRYLSGVPPGHLFTGHLIARVGPIREKWSKYYIPEQVTTAKDYPPYCGGGGLLMSGHTAHAIHEASRALDLFPIDDVFLGMCLQRAGLAPASHLAMRTVGLRVPSSNPSPSFDPCHYRELLLSHRFRPYEMQLMWRELHSKRLRCGKKVAVYPKI